MTLVQTIRKTIKDKWEQGEVVGRQHSFQILQGTKTKKRPAQTPHTKPKKEKEK